MPASIVQNIEADTSAREARIARNAPLRILVPVGGAGAQRRFVSSFLLTLEANIQNGEVQVCFNSAIAAAKDANATVVTVVVLRYRNVMARYANDGLNCLSTRCCSTLETMHTCASLLKRCSDR